VGESPGRVYVFFTFFTTLHSRNAAAGDYNHDPIYFKNLDIRDIYITLNNSKRYPASAIKCNFGEDDFNQLYISLYQNLHTNKSCDKIKKKAV